MLCIETTLKRCYVEIFGSQKASINYNNDQGDPSQNQGWHKQFEYFKLMWKNPIQIFHAKS